MLSTERRGGIKSKIARNLLTMLRREIKQDFEKYAPDIWKREMDAPRFFKNSYLSWLKDYAAFLSFAQDECGEIHGFFNGDKLMCCVYFENRIKPTHLTVHLSVLDKFDIIDAVKEISELRDIQFSKGVKFIDGWILEKNRGLKAMVKAIGFLPTELEMRHGTSHGRSLKWRLFRMKQQLT